MAKFILLSLLLSVPLLSGSPLFGLPAWAWGSLGATLFLALSIVWMIEKEWDGIKEERAADE